ncbi:MAG: ABC transporter permease [Bacteroidia bacterium]|nr:ABC transporter permease [Bacteroidia bacterium]
MSHRVSSYPATPPVRWWAWAWIGLMVLIAAGASLLASGTPLYAHMRGKTYWPTLTPAATDTLYDARAGLWRLQRLREADWRVQPLDAAVWPPVPWHPMPGIYRSKRWQAPGYRPVPGGPSHLLGTTGSGADLLAVLIHGTRTSLLAASTATVLALGLGLLLGGMAGYFQNTRLSARRGQWIGAVAGIWPGWFYGLYLPARYLATPLPVWAVPLGLGISLGIILGCMWLAGRIPGAWWRTKVALPVDTLYLRAAEIIQALPVLMLLIVVAAAFKMNSFWPAIWMIGLTAWPGAGQWMRNAFLQVTATPYIEAARSLGIPGWQIVFRHVLPNALHPLLALIPFVMGNVILLEATLSFLQIIREVVSWGTLIEGIQGQRTAWWVILFPGVAIFMTLTALSSISEQLRQQQLPPSRR